MQKEILTSELTKEDLLATFHHFEKQEQEFLRRPRKTKVKPSSTKQRKRKLAKQSRKKNRG
jgi:hypothetical protein